ncbi:MAG: hypothetical protein AB7N76_22440 [Planctomycetota bacterium]
MAPTRSGDAPNREVMGEDKVCYWRWQRPMDRVLSRLLGLLCGLFALYLARQLAYGASGSALSEPVGQIFVLGGLAAFFGARGAQRTELLLQPERRAWRWRTGYPHPLSRVVEDEIEHGAYSDLRGVEVVHVRRDQSESWQVDLLLPTGGTHERYDFGSFAEHEAARARAAELAAELGLVVSERDRWVGGAGSSPSPVA